MKFCSAALFVLRVILNSNPDPLTKACHISSHSALAVLSYSNISNFELQTPCNKNLKCVYVHPSNIRVPAYVAGLIFIHINVEAYMLTRSVHEPGGILAATRLGVNPFSSKHRIYHGLRPADLRSTLPPNFKARLSALAWAAASAPSGLNQSMLSIKTAIVSEPGCIRAMTSESSSVCIRKPSNALR